MTTRSKPRLHRRRYLGAALAWALLVAMSCPLAAGAHSTGHYFLRAHRAIRFRVHGSHGYAIGVAESAEGHFAVTVRRGTTTAEYALRSSRSQLVARNEVRGTIGALGTFDVRFTPRGKPYRLRPYSWCTGPGPTIQPGVVRGQIRFRGERGYTRAVTHFASAELETVQGQRCHYGERGRSKHPPHYTATFEADDETGGIHFEARRFAPGQRPPARGAFYGVMDYEHLGSLTVTRSVQLAADTSTFRLPNFATAPETAVIQPPAPFAGSATFSRTPESTFSWSGDLNVSFPGLDPIPLAGPNFRLGYCAVRDCINQEAPDERFRPQIGGTSRRSP